MVGQGAEDSTAAIERASGGPIPSVDVLAINALAPRDRAVAGLLGIGETDAEICRRLDLTPAGMATIVERIGLRLFDA